MHTSCCKRVNDIGLLGSVSGKAQAVRGRHVDCLRRGGGRGGGGGGGGKDAMGWGWGGQTETAGLGKTLAAASPDGRRQPLAPCAGAARAQRHSPRASGPIGRVISAGRSWELGSRDGVGCLPIPRVV